jgi:hypothetical protein
VPSYSNNKEALENNIIRDFGIIEGASEYPFKILNFHWDWSHSHPGAKSNGYSFYRHFLSSATFGRSDQALAQASEASIAYEHNRCIPAT